ncbi:MAG: ribosome biogenesis GTPase Der [Candidatus Babeliales bacterium]
MSKVLSKVVIVGRKNVGKSTLFNRLSSTIKSLVLDYAGVTRDVLSDVVTWKDHTFDLVDTGGISLQKSKDPIDEAVRQKALAMLDGASLILFVVDGKLGVVQEDLEIARILHKVNSPVILVVNKADSKETQERLYEFDQLGFSEIVAISAQHGLFIPELLDATIGHIKDVPVHDIAEPAYSIALIGKPNVGKSSLMNLLLQQDRSLVAPEAGTTREAFAEKINFYKETLELIDTPGIRRKRGVTEELEQMMVRTSLRTIKQADIILLLIDAHEGVIADQELKLAFFAFEEQKKALILLFNKQDLMDTTLQEDLKFSLDEYQFLMDKVETLNISCKTGHNVGKIMPLVAKVWERYSKTFDAIELTEDIKSALTRKPLYHVGRQLMVHSVKQIHTKPITILLKVNEPTWFGQSQLAYFDNILRKKYDLKGVPIQFVLAKK